MSTEYRGTPGPDLIDRRVVGPNFYNNYFGEAGDDVLLLDAGNAIGGPGNDRIEAIDASYWIQAAYWDSPTGITADIAGGFALDGWGTRDVLVGVSAIGGSGHDDVIAGSERNEGINPGWSGHDVLDGRGGIDQSYLDRRQSDYVITVSADGRRSVITSLVDPLVRIETTDIEQLFFAGDQRLVWLTDFVTPAVKALGTLLAGDAHRWNAGQTPGSPIELTYSFMTALPGYGSGGGGAGFVALDASQRATVRSILDTLATQIGITFREVTDGTAQYGQLRFGINQQAGTTGYTFLPNQQGAGELAGDVWMDVETMIDLRPGSEGYAQLLHEIGHALGLRHPGNYTAGEAWSETLAAPDDGTWLTVMSANDQAQGLQRSWYGALDLIALRALYGSRAVALGNDTYALSDADGLALRLIADDGGFDVIDASAASAGARIDLRAASPGAVGRTAEALAARENLTVADGALIEAAVGSALDDVLIGNAADNFFTGGGGNDRIEGGGGSDTSLYLSARAQYRVTIEPGREVLVESLDGAGGSDTLISIERLRFSDAELPVLWRREALAPGPGVDPDFLFDPVFYLLGNSALLPSGDPVAARSHYFAAGAAAGLAPASWFDAGWYEQRWNDLRSAGLDDATLFMHFNLFGVWEGRAPGPKFEHFDGNRYLADNPDVAAYVDAYIGDFLGSRTNGAIAHFILFGADELRLAYDTIGVPVELGYVL